MSKLFRTGGTDPLAPGYEPEVEYEYEGLTDDVLSVLVGDLDAEPAPRPAARPVASGETFYGFERGRIDFDRIRREHPIEEVAARLLDGYRQRSPTTSVAACPVHGDDARHPNLHIQHGPHPRSGSWICSSCKAHGDVLDLVKAVMGFTEYRQALDFLDGGQRLPPERQAELARRAEENERRAAAVPVLNTDLVDFAKEAYNRLRGQQNAARDYLARRGLEAAIGRYGLGYVPRGFPIALLPKVYDYEEEAIKPSLGFFDRIIIPYRQPDGTIPVVNARCLIDRKPKYLKPSAGGVRPGSNARPFLIEMAGMQDGVIAITEGEFDAMSLGLCAGDLVREMAIPGVNCFNEKNAESLVARDVVLITDNDAAGRRAQGPIRDLLEAYAERVTVLCTPAPYKDVNELMVGAGKQAVRDWISGATARRKVTRFV